MISAATLSLILALLQDAPELMAAIKADVALLSNDTLTDAQLAANIQAMNIAWTAAKTKWAASALPGDTINATA